MGNDFTGTERFEVLRRIGRGGMGVVYEAYDRVWKQRVALKTLRQLDPATLLRFKREFRSLANVSHPNLVTLYELHTSEGSWFFSMELVDGQDFLRHVRSGGAATKTHTMETMTSNSPGGAMGRGGRDGPLEDASPWLETVPSGPAEVDTETYRQMKRVPSADMLRLRHAAARLARGLAAVHASGHLHRDVKPSNVLVTHEGRVVLMDFGVAVERDPGRHSHIRYGRAGTMGYIAPEVIISGASASTASDWYGFGVILYESLAGMRPFPTRAEAVKAARHGYGPPRASLFQPEVPADLDELCHELLRPDPATRPTTAEILQRLGISAGELFSHQPLQRPTRFAGDFVGRASQLARLDAALDRVRGGQGTAVLLHGRSGLGKSALATAFLDRIEDAVVLHGRCYECENVPYKALDSIVDAIAGLLSTRSEAEQAAALPSDRVALVHAFPVLGRLSGLQELVEDGIAAAESRDMRRRAFAALRELLQKLATQAPLVLFIDDLQWGDADSAPLIVSLMQPPVVPLLLIAAYRSEEAERSALVRELAAARADDPDFSAQVEELALEALTGEECGQLARSLLSEARASDRAGELLSVVQAEAEGSPFFVQELVRFALPRSTEALGGVGLDAMLMARLNDLSPEARRLLEVIAVAGWRIPQRAVQAVSDGDREPLRALAELRAGQFVRADGGEQDSRVESYHDRVREVVARSLDERTRQSIHTRLALALEQCMDEGTEKTFALANHYFSGAGPEHYERSYRLNISAGKLALDALAFERAYHFLGQAHQLSMPLQRQGDPDLNQLLGDACARTGRAGDAVRFFERALERASEPRQRARLHFGLSKLHLGRLDSKTARAEVAQALAEFDDDAAPADVVNTVGTLLALPFKRRFLRRRKYAELPAEERARCVERAALHVHAAYTAYFEMDLTSIVVHTLRGVTDQPRMSLGGCRRRDMAESGVGRLHGRGGAAAGLAARGVRGGQSAWLART
jgi:serine/threonine protein kinase